MGNEIKSERDSDYMPVKEAALISSLSQRTIWRMIADGQLKAYRFRRCTRLLRSQVLSHLQGGAKVGGV